MKTYRLVFWHWYKGELLWRQLKVQAELVDEAIAIARQSIEITDFELEAPTTVEVEILDYYGVR